MTEPSAERDELAQAIRVADGSHRLGAGALAEALIPEVERIVADRIADALYAASWDIVRGADLLPPPNRPHPAVTWLRDRADAMRLSPGEGS